MLLKLAAGVNELDAGPRLSALQLAAALGFRAVVHTLVEYGADINAPHVKGCALVRVVDKKHLELYNLYSTRK